jgi:hypothetical protein
MEEAIKHFDNKNYYIAHSKFKQIEHYKSYYYLSILYANGYACDKDIDMSLQYLQASFAMMRQNNIYDQDVLITLGKYYHHIFKYYMRAEYVYSLIHIYNNYCLGNLFFDKKEYKKALNYYEKFTIDKGYYYSTCYKIASCYKMLKDKDNYYMFHYHSFILYNHDENRMKKDFKKSDLHKGYILVKKIKDEIYDSINLNKHLINIIYGYVSII